MFGSHQPPVSRTLNAPTDWLKLQYLSYVESWQGRAGLCPRVDILESATVPRIVREKRVSWMMDR